MKNFKEMLDRDLDTTFYNTEEFAQVKKVKYDGIIKNIPVIFDSEETVIRVRLSDMGKEPRQGARFYIENELFKVASVLNEYNELIIDLERFDE